MKRYYFLMIFGALCFQSFGQTVSSLLDFQVAVQNSDQEIILEAGTYELDDLPSNSRVIDCSGSNNTIDLTGVRIKVRVGSIREVYFIISGDNNIVRNGAIEDYYQSGLDEVTDYSAYNNERDELAYGLRGDPIMSITGNENLVDGLEMTVKGSFPYGYGSQYGIGSTNTFGLTKRCGILITGTEGGGVGNTLDHITMYHRAFGHGIFMQNNATETTIKNSYIEGRMRLGADMYNDTESYDLPNRTNYLFPADGADSWKIADFPWTSSYAIPTDVMYPLSEDAIRSYNGSGSVIVENCTIKQMRGGIRLYLATSATVSNTTAIDCGETNFNMPNNGEITGSSGNFSFAPLNDHRLSRSRQDIEMTIIPSPNATGPHNIADILGNDHEIVFHRTPGPLDSDEQRAIVVSGDNSTIVNETEYTIILNSEASGNTITSCGPVIDNGSNNTIIESTECDFDFIPSECNNTTALIEAECYDEMFGVETEASEDGTDNIGNVHNGDWAVYNNIDLTDVYSVKARVATVKDNVSIEVRLDALDGELIATIPVTNTGAWQTWATEQVNLGLVDGVHNVYFVFTGGTGGILNANWFGFSEEFICSNTTDLIEAECYDSMEGVKTEGCSEGTLNVGWIQNGDWTQYDGVDLTDMKSIKARVSGKTTGNIIEVRLDGVDGDLIGEIPVTNTGDNQNWVTDSVNIIATSGVHDIYLVFSGGEGYLYNINWFGFSEDELVVTSVNSEIENTIAIYPNPTSGIIHFSTESNYSVSDAIGNEVNNGLGNRANISHLAKGIYFIKVSNENGSNIQKIIKK